MSCADGEFVFYSKVFCLNSGGVRVYLCASVCSVVLKQGQQVVVIVVWEVWRPEVGQQLIWVGQLWKQLQKQIGYIDYGVPQGSVQGPQFFSLFMLPVLESN